jgi:DNA-binding response OmpR family regulator
MRTGVAAAAHRVVSVCRVLVVEDEHAICELISDFLDQTAFEVHCVHSDRGAYTALAGVRPYAALVVDINLGPGTTGFDVARFARQLSPELPVIYVSGETPPSSVATFGVPDSRFLAKPFTTDQLLDMLLEVTGSGT